MPSVRERLNTFMSRQNVTRNQLAKAFSTSVKTMDQWRYSNVTPPSIALAMLDLIEGDPHVRKRLGLSCRKELPRGKPFARGNPWRFGSKTRTAALREAKARREQSGNG